MNRSINYYRNGLVLLPLILRNCLTCHGPSSSEKRLKLRLASKESFRKQLQEGPELIYTLKDYLRVLLIAVKGQKTT